MIKRIFTEEQAANYIGMSCSYLSHDRSVGRTKNQTPGPKFIRMGGRRIGYRREDLNGWISQYKPETKNKSIEN